MNDKKDKKACENEENIKNEIKNWKMKTNNEYAL
jgi:hypothetical protein